MAAEVSYLPRIDHRGYLMQEPTATEQLTAALVGAGVAGTILVKAELDGDGDHSMNVLFHSGLVLGGEDFRVGDIVYVTPEVKGEPMEISRIEEIYDNLLGTEDNIGITFSGGCGGKR